MKRMLPQSMSGMEYNLLSIMKLVCFFSCFLVFFLFAVVVEGEVDEMRALRENIVGLNFLK